MRPLPSSFPFLAPSLSPSISSRPSPAQGSLFSRSFSPSLLPTKVLEKVGDSSRVEGTGERKSERVEEEKESDGVWRRRGREREEKGVKIPRRSGWNPSILSTNPTDDESAMLYRFSSFDSFFFSFFSFFSRSSKPSPIYDAPRALVDVSPDRLKNHYRETIWMGRGARGTRGKYLDGFNRGSFKSQRHEPPVHRACLSSETSEGDKIDLSGPFPLFLSTKPRKDSREIEILLDEKVKHRP